MRFGRFAVTGAVALALACSSERAGACDSTGCLILTRGSNGLLRKGGFSVDLSYRYAGQSKPQRGRQSADFVSRPRVDLARGRLIANYHRDLEGEDSGLQLEAGYGASSRTTVYVSAPVLTLKSHQIGHGSIVTAYDSWGFGDAVIGARQAISLPFSGSASAALALKLPTGKTGLIDSFDSQPLDPVLQPGSGSLEGLRFFHGSFSSYAVVQTPVYRYVNETQLVPRAGVLLGMSRTF